MTAEVTARAIDEIIRPTLREMARRGTPFQGVLYAGLMIDAGQPRLVEYNVRFGDPETQVLALRLGAQLFDAILACAEGCLSDISLNWADDHAITVVMAANGYPGAYEKGTPIHGVSAHDDAPGLQIFHAGTARADDGTLIATGGRVLNVTARSTTLAQARDKAYAAIDTIDWPQGRCRRDIGWRALGT